MNSPLSALLETLKNPENPAFQHALSQLSGINPAHIPAEQLPALMAQIDATINQLTQSKNNVADELGNLRNRARALSSYGK